MPINRDGTGVKLFGVGMDASDDPWTMQLKQAAIEAQQNGLFDFFRDPYDALAEPLMRMGDLIQLGGKVEVPTWLQPIPGPEDSARITQQGMAEFVAQEGVWDLTIRVQQFVEERIFPALPVMLGVDHSASGGTIRAISKKLGPDQLSVVILDQHFDGLPLSLRMDPQLGVPPEAPTGTFGSGYGGQDDNAYCCGNFLKRLMDDGVFLPANLFIIGVADYPGVQYDQSWARFRDSYLDFEKRGCHFLPASVFEGDYVTRLHQLVEEQISTPAVYVSLDLDVGAYRCVHAARYMDCVGLERRHLMDVACIIADGCRKGRFRLVGLDVMEFNMHFLGVEYEPGRKDETLAVALEFMTHVLGGEE